MFAALLNILGALGFLAFLLLLLLRGEWVREASNRAVALALILFSVGCITQAMAFDQFDSTAETMRFISFVALGGSLAAAVLWFMRSSNKV